MVVRSGSFSKAAASLSIDPSGLSRQVRKLEDSVRSQLLYRNGRGVELTAAGRTFHETVSNAMAILKRAYDEAADESAMPKGRVVVGLPDSVSGLIGVPLLRSVQASHPEVRLHLMDGLASDIQEWLACGRVDIAVLPGARQSIVPTMQPFLSESLFLIGSHVPPGSVPRSGGYEIAFTDLATLPLVMPSAERELLIDLDQDGCDCPALNIVNEIDSSMALKAMVADGHAYALVPFGCIHAEVASGRLVASRVVGPEIINPLYIGCASNRPYTSAMRHVSAQLRDLAAFTAERHVGWHVSHRDPMTNPARST
jgi:LysR family transcriptional regulator, nitrogen assimilation regulatory protein